MMELFIENRIRLINYYLLPLVGSFFLYFYRMNIIFKTLLILLISLNTFAQDGIVRSIFLDSVMISSVKEGFSVEEFVHYVKSDTSFYQGFKNLRYYPHDYDSELTIFNTKNEQVGFLYRSGKYEVEDNILTVSIDSSYDDGKIYNRKGKYKYYTPEFFDYVFFPKDTLTVSKYSKRDNEDADDKDEQNENDAKVIVFNPGSIKVEKSTGNSKKKLAIFDVSMQKYYDYKISQTFYKDSIECYAFTCVMKDSLSSKDKDDVLIRELVSYFDKDNFKILYRKYVMQYDYWVVDLEVTVEVEMGYNNNVLVPEYIYYKGYWDIPFKKAEVASFKLWNKNFIYRD